MKNNYKCIYLNDDDFLSLPSFLTYKHLNTYRYHLYVDNDDNCENLKNQLSNYQEIENFCMRLTGILSKHDEFSTYGIPDNDRCKIVNYWMYDFAFDKIIKGDDSVKLAHFIDKISDYWNNTLNMKKCGFIKGFANKNDFYKTKRLYDYSVDLKTIEHKLKANNNMLCSKKYSEYINKGNTEYNEAKIICTKNDGLYCKNYNDMKNYFKDYDISKLLCKEISENETVPGDISDTSGKVISGKSGDDPTLSSTVKRKLLSTARIILATVLPFLVFSFILLIFCNKTTFISLIRKYLQKKRLNIFFKGEEAQSNIFGDVFEYFNVINKYTEHHIGYYPSYKRK
ncbi:variable surface protein [Plasmodium gonderi]|uniref:Variable surface protein n=1 Tax=Plasmodium gonderi TaxID=77519 RepID=A0A1Y1JMP3_PLAGO|nr:variable surface protein [Plasmodium gonderi]GAW82745.1 variable surface protein [Plasmodium gonderi]